MLCSTKNWHHKKSKSIDFVFKRYNFFWFILKFEYYIFPIHIVNFYKKNSTRFSTIWEEDPIVEDVFGKYINKYLK